METQPHKSPTPPELLDRSQSLPPETLRRFGAFRKLLSLPEFRDEFLPGLRAERLEYLQNLPDEVAEQTLRLAFVRWKHACEIGTDMQQFVDLVEKRLAEPLAGPGGNSM